MLHLFPARSSAFVCALMMVLLTGGCGSRAPDGRTHITYWEKWTGAEVAAMQQTVDASNASQDKIFVEFLAVGGEIDREVLLATASGDLPDIAGVWPPRLLRGQIATP